LKTYYVYFIQAKKEKSPVKIGYTSNVKKRIENLQVGNPFKLEAKILIPFESEKEAISVEKILHNQGRLYHKQLSGEWFYIYGTFALFLKRAYSHIEEKQANRRNSRRDRKAEKHLS